MDNATREFDPQAQARAHVDEDPLPEELAERGDLQRVLSEAIAKLPPAYAEVVALRYAVTYCPRPRCQ